MCGGAGVSFDQNFFPRLSSMERFHWNLVLCVRRWLTAACPWQAAEQFITWSFSDTKWKYQWESIYNGTQWYILNPIGICSYCLMFVNNALFLATIQISPIQIISKKFRAWVLTIFRANRFILKCASFKANSVDTKNQYTAILFLNITKVRTDVQKLKFSVQM